MSNHIQVPSHKQVPDDKTNGPEEVKSSKVKKCVKKSRDSNKNEHQASNGEHVREAEEKKTVVSNDKHCDAEKPCSDSEALPLAVTKSLGVENKGFDCNEVESTLCSPDQIVVTNVDEVDKSEVVANSMEQNHRRAVLEALSNKKPFVASSDLESAPVVPPRPKTVRAWLKDPHLYKVTSLFNSRLFSGIHVETRITSLLFALFKYPCSLFHLGCHYLRLHKAFTRCFLLLSATVSY